MLEQKEVPLLNTNEVENKKKYEFEQYVRDFAKQMKQMANMQKAK